ncbi:MAG TPA: sulfur carrier protein ThiS [Pseudonocardiaceae bacterium]
MTGVVNVSVNGKSREFAEGSTVGDLMRRLSAPASGVAVARAGEVVPKTSWDETSIEDGDVIEILTAVQGG